MSSFNEFFNCKKHLSIFDPVLQTKTTATATTSSGNSSTRTTTLPKKPISVRNVATNNQIFDSLHFKANESTLCNQRSCLGSCLATNRLQQLNQQQPRTADDILTSAKDFLEQYYASIKRLNSASHLTRWEQVQKQVKQTGTYQLTETELTFGAKTAWRNATRCIGRIQWSKLQVFDCRYVTTTSGMFEALCNHIKYATNKGNIRSAITIFPQRRTGDSKHDYRVWNSQLISYAGYRQDDGSVVGDPLNIEFTEICLKLGWRKSFGAWDILPLVLSANGHDPDYFDLPADLVLEVPLLHPRFDWFRDLNLKWYALPAVSALLFDCGGLEFTAAPFNGWYMSTEIGCRNLCDSHRLNLMEPIALRMGLDTQTSVTLWKDRALIECNIAVLHSFQTSNVTIVDHHTASDSFMKFLENESRSRSGCPADWVWIVPPLSGSATPVFHQEMIMYFLKPSYEYQEPAWKSHVWKKGNGCGNGARGNDSIAKTKKSHRKFHFKQIARAVKFTSKLFGKALSRRIKATVLYATETGRSETFAKKLCELFSHAFNAQVYCMLDYDISSIEHETLLLVVTSTFGNGDPPENGELFARSLYSMKFDDSPVVTKTTADDPIAPNTKDNNGEPITTKIGFSKSFIKANSNSDLCDDKFNKTKHESFRLTITNEDHVFGPLSNIRYAVFALGSSAYPNFCAFGQYVDRLLGELGGERLLDMFAGDEMCGQEQSFVKWSQLIFKIACETFCLDEETVDFDRTLTIKSDNLSLATIRCIQTAKAMPLDKAYMKCFNKNVSIAVLRNKRDLHATTAPDTSLARETMLFEFATELAHCPGDHVGVFAENDSRLVAEILARLDLGAIGESFTVDEPIELQVLKETYTFNGTVKSWNPHERLPVASLRTLFVRFLDVTTPPAPNLLQYFASIAAADDDRQRLQLLSSNAAEYEDWKHWYYPNLAEVLAEFKSVRPHPLLLATQLNLLQPRFYSISSSLAMYPKQIHLTVAVVTYTTQNNSGSVHYGVCSNYLKNLPLNSQIYTFIRSAPNFHLPPRHDSPVILVGPGTGIAPFRSFWQQRYVQTQQSKQTDNFGPFWLFFGCRTLELDLYTDEKQQMIESGVLSRAFLALSRPQPFQKKNYVQDLIQLESKSIYELVVERNGHFYVCGDCKMAEDVYQTLRMIVKQNGRFDDKQADEYMFKLRDENRYHEDIFGITLRTTEVHNKSRQDAREKMAQF